MKGEWKYKSKINYYGINNDKEYSITDQHVFDSEQDAKNHLEAEYKKAISGMMYVSRYGKKNFERSISIHVAGCLNRNWNAEWSAKIQKA